VALQLVLRPVGRKCALAADKIEKKKESEIPSVRKLIEMLDLKNVTFTLDALHCQEKTLKTIRETKNHYIIGVKKNQKNLLGHIKKTSKRNRSICKKREK